MNYGAHSQQAANLPIPLNLLAGKDITELEQMALKAAADMKKRGEELHPTDEPTTATAGTGKGTETVAGAEAGAEAALEISTSTSTSASIVSLGSGSAGPADVVEQKVEDGVQTSDDSYGVPKDDGPFGAEPPTPPLSSALFDDVDSVFLGLHVYTDKEAQSEIHGQLRHEMGVGFAGLAVTGL
jgi:hypothetical protein